MGRGLSRTAAMKPGGEAQDTGTARSLHYRLVRATVGGQLRQLREPRKRCPAGRRPQEPIQKGAVQGRQAQARWRGRESESQLEHIRVVGW